jgi:hypothetical protein
MDTREVSMRSVQTVDAAALAAMLALTMAASSVGPACAEANVTIRSDLPAMVELKGEKLGETPITLRSLSRGTHSLRVVALDTGETRTYRVIVPKKVKVAKEIRVQFRARPPARPDATPAPFPAPAQPQVQPLPGYAPPVVPAVPAAPVAAVPVTAAAGNVAYAVSGGPVHAVVQAPLAYLPVPGGLVTQTALAAPPIPVAPGAVSALALPLPVAPVLAVPPVPPPPPPPARLAHCRHQKNHLYRHHPVRRRVIALALTLIGAVAGAEVLAGIGFGAAVMNEIIHRDRPDQR